MLRRAIDVSGIVQGVGFRPFVYDLATRLGLNGFVRNRTGGVLIEVEGEAHSLDRFLAELQVQAAATGANRRGELGVLFSQGRPSISDRIQQARVCRLDLHLARRRHM